MGLSIDNKEYFYIKDILENIIGIIDQKGNVVVYYRYDAYGKLSPILSEYSFFESAKSVRFGPEKEDNLRGKGLVFLKKIAELWEDSI